jgi:hypothetical protein
MEITNPMKLENDTLICDSGACGNYCQFVEGLSNVKDINEKMKIRNGHRMVEKKLGDLK